MGLDAQTSWFLFYSIFCALRHYRHISWYAILMLPYDEHIIFFVRVWVDKRSHTPTFPRGPEANKRPASTAAHRIGMTDLDRTPHT